MRGVDHGELVGKDAARTVLAKAPAGKGRTLDTASLSSVFGIDLAPRKNGRSGRKGQASRAATPPGKKPKKRMVRALAVR